MRSLSRPSKRAACAVLLALISSGSMISWSSPPPAARAAGPSGLQRQISAGKSRISSLSGAVKSASGRLAQLNASIASLERRISRIQAELNAKRAELLRLRSQLIAARTRLAQLEAFEAHAETVLSHQLVNAYETDRPDIVSVVLEARGFQDLLERIAFATRIRKQDVHVVDQVRAARSAVAAQATRLGGLEARQQVLTTQVLEQRNSLARDRLNVVQQQLAVAQVRQAKASQLSAARGQVATLQRQLSKLQAAQAAATPPSSGASSASGRSSASPQVSSGGGFTFPMPKGAASPPGTWTLDQGVDIAAPGGTQELAVCSGTIVLHGIGGFGPWAPVLHCDSPISGFSYVYYGHAGPANQLPIGTHVGAGQVMSEVGPGIVGISSGPHLEIGFCDSSGTPLGGGTASQMMSLLQGAY
jgi:murein DD-endopeptidase MepM/ murein hydrolase activator NlpD